ncbi:hypothetical protein [uncultured Amphritea sp.]|uniref:hypothetical protein n=1 Tax=uncultured Amphritea sp. TaxID=981605 RepID=UPI00261C8DA5|nr:hypothetical protein [uncultured Amphritea sp.]
MRFIIRANDAEFSIDNGDRETPPQVGAENYLIADADTLLRLYVATDRDDPLFAMLQQLRAHFLNDLDNIETQAEIYGLIHWLLDDNAIRADGASLEETADRLSEIDIAADSDQYTKIIFHLRDAIDRLYEMELDDF